jgi:hypothetical protein
MSPKGFTNSLVIGIIALAVLVLGIGWYVALVKKQERVVERPIPTLVPVQETMHWNVCRNEKYGYEVKYPSNWKVWKPGAPEIREATCEENLSIISFSQNPDTNQPQIIIDVSDPFRLKGTIYEGVKSLDEYFSRSPTILQARPIVKESTLDGEKLVWHSDGSLTAFHNGSIFEFRRSNNVDDETMARFLSTFKFLK